ncbi:MAG: spore coat U domain-containing protein [Snowella sp.]|nr:spore coat U domain-containing protein [Snowella sp.]
MFSLLTSNYQTSKNYYSGAFVNMKITSISLLSSRALLLTATAATLALSNTLISKPAFAGTATTNLDLSASVTNSCTISTSSVAFGSYDPTSNSDATATGTVTTLCTNGASATITLGQGSNPHVASTDAAPFRQLRNGTDFLLYNLFQNAERTTLWGNTAGTGLGITSSGTSQNTTVYGSILQQQNVPAGNYSDTVTATVTF